MKKHLLTVEGMDAFIEYVFVSYPLLLEDRPFLQGLLNLMELEVIKALAIDRRQRLEPSNN